MDTILLLVILALAASGGEPEDTSSEAVSDPVYSESQTSQEQWNTIRQHPELSEVSGEQKPYTRSVWSWLFKKPASKEKGGAKAKVAADAEKKGDSLGEGDVSKPDENIKTRKNTTSALKAEAVDDASKAKKPESAGAMR